MPRTVELLCKASLLGGPRAPTGHPKEARLECCGQRPGQGCPELPGCCPSAVLSSPSPPQKTAPPHPPQPLGQGSSLWESPGSGLLLVPRWDRPQPCHVCPCSNGILYQYPDRTDVIPLLSVNMG